MERPGRPGHDDGHIFQTRNAVTLKCMDAAGLDTNQIPVRCSVQSLTMATAVDNPPTSPRPALSASLLTCKLAP